MTIDPKITIAVLGGTGKEGGGLALRWAAKGYDVVIGGRSAERSAEAASEINKVLGREAVRGFDNMAAAAAADLAVLSVPFSAQLATAQAVADHLCDKILIDVTVPLVPPKVGRVQLPNGRSAVEQLQEALPDTRVVSAFQNISAHHLWDLEAEMDCDVLVCSDHAEDAELVVGLAKAIGMRAWNAGPLCNSVVSEALTSVLITLNRRYKVPGSGIRITGLPDAA